MRGLDPAIVKYLFMEMLAQSTQCIVEDGVVRLETPFMLPDGHLVRVYFRLGLEQEVIVSDGGYTSRMVTVFSRFEEEARARYEKLRQIARDLGVEYADGELRFVAPSLEQAVRRVPVLAHAVVAGLGMLTW